MIVKKNLSEQIYDSLKRDILAQKIGFGEKLINRGLQEKFGVSSTPVRDAINRLYLDGLLDDISNVGARVITFDYKMALEVNELMAIFTTEAMSLAARKSDLAEVVESLEKCVALQHENMRNKQYFKHDKQFHSVFFKYSDNAQFSRLYDQYSVLWELLVQVYYRDKESTRTGAIAQHEEILAAYRGGDIVLARLCMETHFHDAIRHLGKMLDVRPVEAEPVRNAE